MPRRNKKKSGSKRNISSHSSNGSTQINGEKDDTEELAYVIRNSDIMGRYLVASRNLTAGSVIIREDALVVGPCQNSDPLCLGCYIPIQDLNTTYRCKKCNWPICSENCKGLYRKYGHSQEECDLLASSKESAPKLPLKEKIYNTIVPLRCLLLKNTDKWEILKSMESHDSIRIKIPIIWNTNQVTVVDQLRKHWELTQYSEEEIHTICGIMEVNAFEIGHNGMRLQGLFPSAFLIAHECVPNTMHTDCNFHLTVRTAVPVYTGDMFTLTYAYTLQSTMKRREHLKESKFFDCVCKRCSDATELGTYTSAIRCQQCSSGWLLSSAPLQYDATWHCNSTECPGYSMTSESVDTLMERINKEVESIDNNSVEALEDFLQRFSNVLHPNHYHILGIKYSLSQLYGKVEGYMIHEMSNAFLQRKQDLCRELLKVFDVLEPGMSRLRGVTLYELHAPLMTMTTRDFENQNITKKELKNRLKKVVSYLKEASEILSLEEGSSAEGLMCIAAKDALVKMQSWQQIIGAF